MDVDTARVGGNLTDEEKNRLMKEKSVCIAKRDRDSQEKANPEMRKQKMTKQILTVWRP